MSRWSNEESYQDRRKRERQEEREYRSTVDYEVYRSGRNADRIDYDRVSDLRSDGYSAYDAGASEARRLRNEDESRREREESLQSEEDYYASQYCEEQYEIPEQPPDEPAPPDEGRKNKNEAEEQLAEKLINETN